MIPAEFLLRMQGLLGEEYPAFFAALSAPATHALRVNTLKTEPRELLPLLGFTPTPLPFSEDGFAIPEGERAGLHPLHHAGAYYMQDASAMATVAAFPYSLKGARVLDMCAAPGGKSGQLAARIGEGILVSNELVGSRARILLGNMERLGVSRELVTSLPPSALAEAFPAYFDLTVVDAPCSGEGMFRKYPDAAREWSPSAVTAAAGRAALILDDAARTVRAGGHLLFSTCTFSEEENEETITAFLARHPDFSLVSVAPAVEAVTSPGIVRHGRPAEIEKTRRFYPHKSEGEGQYLALLARTAGGGSTPLPPAASSLLPLSRSEEAEVRAALAELMTTPPKGRLARIFDTILLYPEELPPLSRGVLRAGVALFEKKGKLLVPHHHAASAFGGDFRRRVELVPDSPEAAAYLRGEELPAPPDVCGFAAVTLGGIPVGLAKCAACRLKNHYPKGLRTHG